MFTPARTRAALSAFATLIVSAGLGAGLMVAFDFAARGLAL